MAKYLPQTIAPSLPDFLANEAARHPGRTFVRFASNRYSYQKIYDHSRSFAAYLQSLDLKKGFKVGILSKNRPELITAYLGAAISGGIAIPINYFQTQDEIEYIALNSGMDILVFSGEYEKNFRQLFNKKSDIRHYICLDNLQDTKALNYSHLVESFSPASYRKPDFSPHDTAAILYTSGTTGNPKGVMLSHENLISDAVYIAEDFKPSIRGKVKYVQFLPLFHSFSFMAGVFCMWHLGATVSLLETVLPFEKVIKTILKHRINILIGIPQLFRVLSEKKVPRALKGFLKLVFPIKLCVSGGAPLSLTVMANFKKNFGIDIFQGYGLTEASPIVSVNNKYKNKPGSVGIPPRELLSIQIVDDEGNSLPTGEIGELAVKGRSVMTGYYRNESATKEILKDGWLFTGDIAKVDTEGYLFLVDRKKDLIISKGMNIYPAEVEETLKKHPDVKEVAVVGIPDTHHGEIPVAVLEMDSQRMVSASELKKFCHLHEASYKVPKFFEFWDALPRNSTGKILKREIRRILLEKQKKI